MTASDRVVVALTPLQVQALRIAVEFVETGWDGGRAAGLTKRELSRMQAADVILHRALIRATAPDATAPPRADWSSVWAELTGYVRQAAEDGTPIDAAGMAAYLSELKHRAMAPVREWADALTRGTPNA